MERTVLNRVKLLAATIAAGALLTTTLVRAGGDAADEAMSRIRPEAIRADMRFLASDHLEGRGTGTRGHEIAAEFIAAQFEADGLEPAGDKGTYFQSVPFRSFRPDETQTSLTILRGGKEETFTFGKDFMSIGDPARKETSVEAPVVYVGFGVTAPELGYDDYRGIDVKGKIVALLSFGAPASFASSLRAHYSADEVKAANAAAHGAAGVLLLDSPDLEKIYPFNWQVRDLAFPGFRWLSPVGKPNDHYPELRGNAFLSIEGVKKLLAGSGMTAEELYGAASEGKPVSRALPVTAKIHNLTKLEDVRSPNVVARLRGSDPALRDEYVVYTAHADHLGIGETIDGDNIYNGALDNASGSAALLEIAKTYSRMNTRPRRSILFVSVTGEEAGLLGSDYFAHYPTVQKGALAANINMDGAALLWPMEDVVAYGEEHSSLAAPVREAARRMKLDVSPDLQPEQAFFIRYGPVFVRQGGRPRARIELGAQVERSEDPAERDH